MKTCVSAASFCLNILLSLFYHTCTLLPSLQPYPLMLCDQHKLKSSVF